MRAWGDTGLSRLLALLEVLLSLIFFGAVVAYARLSGAVAVRRREAGGTVTHHEVGKRE
jgi:uncharacterized membrane protein